MTNPPPPPGTANTIFATYDDHQSSTDTAHLQLFSSGSTVSANLVFHQNIRNGLPAALPAFVRETARHEGGHAQGLDNASNCPPGSTIMNLDPGEAETQITTCDNDAISANPALRHSYADPRTEPNAPKLSPAHVLSKHLAVETVSGM